MARKVSVRSLDSVVKTGEHSKYKHFNLKGNRQLSPPKLLLLCEDTSSAYYYYKYFISQYGLNVVLEPKAKSLRWAKKDYPDGLNEIFRKAASFHEINDEQQILIAFDTDEFYWKTNPKIKNRNAYEKFVSDNSGHRKFIFLDTFPCFEYWLFLHFSQSDKYFEGFDSLLPELNRLLRKNKIKTLDNTVCSEYSKAESFWVKRVNNKNIFFASNFPTTNLLQAISYSYKHESIVGTNSHSNIWRFFSEFKELIPEIQSAFAKKEIDKRYVSFR